MSKFIIGKRENKIIVSVEINDGEVDFFINGHSFATLHESGELWIHQNMCAPGETTYWFNVKSIFVKEEGE